MSQHDQTSQTDAQASFQRLEGFVRRVLAVPKASVEARLAKEKASKPKPKKK
jgi:hypothetical protein